MRLSTPVEVVLGAVDDLDASGMDGDLDLAVAVAHGLLQKPPELLGHLRAQRDVDHRVLVMHNHTTSEST